MSSRRSKEENKIAVDAIFADICKRIDANKNNRPPTEKPTLSDFLQASDGVNIVMNKDTHKMPYRVTNAMHRRLIIEDMWREESTRKWLIDQLWNNLHNVARSKESVIIDFFNYWSNVRSVYATTHRDVLPEWFVRAYYDVHSADVVSEISTLAVKGCIGLARCIERCHVMECYSKNIYDLVNPPLFDKTTVEYMDLMPVFEVVDRVRLFREMYAYLPSIRNWMQTGCLELQEENDARKILGIYDLEHMFIHWPRILNLYETSGLLHLAPAWFIHKMQSLADETGVQLSYPVLQRYYLQMHGSISKNTVSGKVPALLTSAPSSSTAVKEDWVAEYEAGLANLDVVEEKTQEVPLQGISVEQFADSESADELAQDLADEFANELVVGSTGISSTMSANVDQLSMRDVGSIASSAAAHGATLARVSRFCEAMAIGKSLCNTR
jgi:hypothetical protein